MIHIDSRTGREYEQPELPEGHPSECLCGECLVFVINDMVEAGVMEMVGVAADGDLLFTVKEQA